MMYIETCLYSYCAFFVASSLYGCYNVFGNLVHLAAKLSQDKHNRLTNITVKPQRPVRSVRIHADENMPSLLPNHKIIHQRNKSSPALSTMANVGVLKAAAKRTAFGDVSNTANVNRSSRDDMVLTGKTGSEVIEKAIQLQQDKKATSLLKPAQRPLSVSGLKSLLSNVTNSSTAVVTKPALLDVAPAPQPANTRKLLMKRATTIFKDQIQTQSEQPVLIVDKPLPSASLTAQVHPDLVSQENGTERPEETQPKLRKTKSTYIADHQSPQEILEISNPSAYPQENVIVRSDGAYIDEQGHIRLCDYVDETNHIQDSVCEPNNGVPLPQEPKKVPLGDNINGNDNTLIEKSQVEMVKKSFPPVSEPEEYWEEEEEEEENYDEEGYATARSFKSRGDNTTGGATTILFPKVNQKVKKELAAAKQLIESTRTAEEIEDEAWDTSMVAEYGDEIFQYMRDLEVSDCPARQVKQAANAPH